MKDMHNEEEGDGLAVPLPDRLAGTHRRPAGRVRDLLPRLATPSGSLVGLGLLLQLNDRHAELVGDGMADRVPLPLRVLLPRPLVARQDLTHTFHTFCQTILSSTS